MSERVEICVWPRCEAEPTRKVDVPLCDAHVAKTYRRVSEAMRKTEVPRLRIDAAQARLATNARRNAKDAAGTVYFARIGELVKIGFSTNMAQRMSVLRPDEVLATIDGTMRDEEALHHRFGSLWVRGELFRHGGELAAYIDTLRGA